MADVTGPIATLPGTTHRVPEGMCCDTHPDRPATHRVQGETDSFGCEMIDMCDECFAEEQERAGQDAPGYCDWCKCMAANLKPKRDFEEGSAGQVYMVCSECSARYNARIAQEYADEFENDWDF